MSGLTLQVINSWSAVIQPIVRGKALGHPQSRSIKCSALYFDFKLLLHLSELPQGVRSDCVRAYVTKASLTRTEPRFRRKVSLQLNINIYIEKVSRKCGFFTIV